MESDSQRFDQGALQCAHIVRKFKAKISLVRHILLKHAVYRRSCKEHHVGTEVVSSCLTEFAVSTCLSGFQCHTISCFQMSNILSYFHNSASRLMAEHERRLDYIVPDRTGLIIMQVASADSHIFQLYKHLVVLYLRDIALLKSHFPDSEHNRCFHFSFHFFFSFCFDFY